VQRRSQKRKKTVKSLIALLGSAHVKVASKMLMKLIPDYLVVSDMILVTKSFFAVTTLEGSMSGMNPSGNIFENIIYVKCLYTFGDIWRPFTSPQK